MLSGWGTLLLKKSISEKGAWHGPCVVGTCSFDVVSQLTYITNVNNYVAI